MTQWESLGQPASPAEAEALDRLRDVVCKSPIAYGWTNVTFVDLHGRTAELDAVVVTPVGVFVIELKGWHGRISGNQQTWRVTSAGGTTRTNPNPLWLTESKAKRLKSLLQDRARNSAERAAVPFIGALVVVHGRDSAVELDDRDAQRILALDGAGVRWTSDHLLSRFLQTVPTSSRDAIDGPTAKKIRLLMSRAGFVATPKTRMVGQYVIDRSATLAEGPSWQDLLAAHPDLPGVQRRIRLFDVPPGASEEQRQEIVTGARREYRLTEGLHHDGVVSPMDFVATESGPALIFDHEPDSLPLDQWLAEHEATLDLDGRLALVRSIGEVLRWAHERRLTHRALTPRQVHVLPPQAHRGQPRVRIQDWWTGRRTETSRTTATSLTVHSRGAVDVRSLVEQQDWLYLAPEQHAGHPDLPPIPLDVYGLGALAFLVLTGKPPASSLAELEERIDAVGGLDPTVAAPELPESFAEVVLAATRVIEAERTASVRDVLDQFDLAYERATEPVQEPRTQVDPVDAAKGDALDERFLVVARRGTGATGVALEVDDLETEQEGLVLKVARDERAAARIDAEAAALARLDHKRVVRLVEGPIDVGGRRAVLLEDAGKETLAGRLATEGRSTIEQLERYGADLLEAVAHLDSRGIFHRDIKPANLGIRPDPSNRRPRLTLFDLSLAAEPLTDLGTGTPDYLDPYLGGPRRKQFDRAAELYAVAVTLFQMATGQMPWWVEGGTRPRGPKDAIGFTADTFEPAVSAGMLGFFTQAFAPDVADRFRTVESMTRAWTAVFADLDAPGQGHDDVPGPDAAASAATLDTPLTEAGLSPRALSGLRRLGVSTVRDLLARNPVEVNAIGGLGERYRKEIQARIRQWRADLQAPHPSQAEADIDPTAGVGAVEVVLERLLTSGKRRKGDDAVRALLDGTSGEQRVDVGWWPSVADVAVATESSRSDVSDALSAAVVRWTKQPALQDVLDEVFAVLETSGRVATVTEVSTALLRKHGSAAPPDERFRRAVGLVRAAVEVDAAAADPRLAVRRLSRPGGAPRVLLAVEAPGPGALSAEALLDLAEALGQAADALLEAGEPVPHSRAGAVLQSMPGASGLDADRVLRLAALTSRSAALSAGGELYPRGMSWQVAVRSVLVGLGLRSIDVAGIRRRVSVRFPEAQEVPGRPVLDAVVEEAIPGMRPDGDRFERAEPTTAATALTGRSQTRSQTEPARDVLTALRSSLGSRSAMTLCARPERYDATASALGEAFPELVTVDVAAELVRAARDLAAEEGAEWATVEQLDAQPPGSQGGAMLRAFLQPAIEARWEQLMASESPLLLLHAGPLLRFGHEGGLARMLDLATRRPAARWLLVPRSTSQVAPTLDGHAIPFGADRWRDVPSDLGSTVSSGAPS